MFDQVNSRNYHHLDLPDLLTKFPPRDGASVARYYEHLHAGYVSIRSREISNIFSHFDQLPDLAKLFETPLRFTQDNEKVDYLLVMSLRPITENSPENLALPHVYLLST